MMKTLNFLLISLLLLAPAEYLGKCGVRGILGESVSNYEVNKRSDNFTNTYYKASEEYTPRTRKEPMQVKVRYEPTPEETCSAAMKASRPPITECDICSTSDAAKDAAAKWKASLLEKTKNQELKVPRSPEGAVKADNYREKYRSCHSEPKMGETLCADCDRCEVQIKSSGDGIVLKCQQCRQVPSDQVTFPSGNNQKIIKLP